MTEAAEAARVAQALQDAKSALGKKKQQGALRVDVLDLQFSLQEDQTGDPAIIVTAVLPQDTSDEEWTSQNLEPIAEEIRSQMRGIDTDRWVYVRFTKPSVPDDDVQENENGQGAS